MTRRPMGFTLIEQPFDKPRAVRRREGSAFTLIELLVVVAIMALLIGLLAPSLHQARDQAKTTVCASNMRQVALGWTLYALTHNDKAVAGRMPKYNPKSDPRNMYYVGNGRQYRPRWYIMLGAESGFYAYDDPSVDPSDDNTKQIDNEVFLCPKVPRWVNNRNHCYGYNYQFLGNSRTRSGGTVGHDFVNWPVNASRINGAGTVLAADNLGTAASFAVTERRPYDATCSRKHPANWGEHGWSLDPPRRTPDSDTCNNEERGSRSAPDPRHNGKANFSFCDGHVDTATPESMGYVINDDGSIDLDGGPGASNVSFSGTGRDEDPPPI